MFNVADREKLRARLVEVARDHRDIEAAALLGSAARGQEDRWSDIDLALGLAPGVDPHAAAESWTAVVEQTEPVVDHLDIEASGGLYRVLLLASTLQVDLSFWPHGHLPAGDSSVQVLFGDTATPTAPALAEEDLSSRVRMSWVPVGSRTAPSRPSGGPDYLTGRYTSDSRLLPVNVPLAAHSAGAGSRSACGAVDRLAHNQESVGRAGGIAPPPLGPTFPEGSLS